MSREGWQCTFIHVCEHHRVQSLTSRGREFVYSLSVSSPLSLSLSLSLSFSLCIYIYLSLSLSISLLLFLSLSVSVFVCVSVALHLAISLEIHVHIYLHNMYLYLHIMSIGLPNLSCLRNAAGHGVGPYRFSAFLISVGGGIGAGSAHPPPMYLTLA